MAEAMHVAGPTLDLEMLGARIIQAAALAAACHMRERAEQTASAASIGPSFREGRLVTSLTADERGSQ